MPADIQTKEMHIRLSGDLYFLTDERNIIGLEIGGETVSAYSTEPKQFGEYVGRHKVGIKSVCLSACIDPESKYPPYGHVSNLAIVELSIREWYPNSERLNPAMRAVIEQIIPEKCFNPRTRTYRFTVPQDALTVEV